MEIKFSKQALANLEEIEEAQDIIDEIEKAVKDGTLFTESEPVDMEKLKEEEPDVYEALIRALNEIDDGSIAH